MSIAPLSPNIHDIYTALHMAPAQTDATLGIALPIVTANAAASTEDEDDNVYITPTSPLPQEPLIKSVTTESFTDGEDRRRLKRFMIVSELVETEQSYVQDLQNLVRNFFDPLNNAYLATVSPAAASRADRTAAEIVQDTTFGSTGWITFDQKQAIVRNAATLLRVQKLFSKLLLDAVRKDGTDADGPMVVCSDPSPRKIAQCFQSMLAKLESVYLPFCAQHDSALLTIAALKKTHPGQYQAFIDECRGKMATRLELQDFLIKPVQRICKYPLLLQEIFKTTEAGTEDQAEMESCLADVKTLVLKINQRKRELENERKKEAILTRLHSGNQESLVSLASTFHVYLDGDWSQRTLLPSPAGTEVAKHLGVLSRGSGLIVLVHRDHALPFVTPAAQEPELQYHGVFLMSECMLILHPKKQKHYSLNFFVPISRVVNVQELQNEYAVAPDADPRLKHAWRITWEIHMEGSHQPWYRSVDFGAKTAKDKTIWMAELARLLPPSKFASLDTEAEQALQLSIQTSTEHQWAAWQELETRFADVFTTESLVASTKAQPSVIKSPPTTIPPSPTVATITSNPDSVTPLQRQKSNKSQKTSRPTSADSNSLQPSTGMKYTWSGVFKGVFSRKDKPKEKSKASRSSTTLPGATGVVRSASLQSNHRRPSSIAALTPGQQAQDDLNVVDGTAKLRHRKSQSLLNIALVTGEHSNGEAARQSQISIKTAPQNGSTETDVATDKIGDAPSLKSDAKQQSETVSESSLIESFFKNDDASVRSLAIIPALQLDSTLRRSQSLNDEPRALVNRPPRLADEPSDQIRRSQSLTECSIALSPRARRFKLSPGVNGLKPQPPASPPVSGLVRRTIVRKVPRLAVKSRPPSETSIHDPGPPPHRRAYTAGHRPNNALSRTSSLRQSSTSNNYDHEDQFNDLGEAIDAQCVKSVATAARRQRANTFDSASKQLPKRLSAGLVMADYADAMVFVPHEQRRPSMPSTPQPDGKERRMSTRARRTSTIK